MDIDVNKWRMKIQEGNYRRFSETHELGMPVVGENKYILPSNSYTSNVAENTVFVPPSLYNGEKYGVVEQYGSVDDQQFGGGYDGVKQFKVEIREGVMTEGPKANVKNLDEDTASVLSIGNNFMIQDVKNILEEHDQTY